jgi:hypothetical protein
VKEVKRRLSTQPLQGTHDKMMDRDAGILLQNTAGITSFKKWCEMDQIDKELVFSPLSAVARSLRPSKTRLSSFLPAALNLWLCGS